MSVEMQIRESKSLRKQLDVVRQALSGADRRSRERSLAMTKIQEAIMWLGMDLKALNDGVSCYAEGYNPDSALVEDPPEERSGASPVIDADPTGRPNTAGDQTGFDDVSTPL